MITNIQFIEQRPHVAYQSTGNLLTPANPFDKGTPEHDRFQIFSLAWQIKKEGAWPDDQLIDRSKVKLTERPVTWHYANGLTIEDAIPVAIYIN